MTYYQTDIGVSVFCEYDVLYFSNYGDLLDHLQNCFNATADEIEFSDEYQYGLLFLEKRGNIDKQFCDNHNSSRIDLDNEYELDSYRG